MPRTGGEADKFGNRYESLWTVDAVLDLIDGKYTELTVEPLGDEAAGIEFFGTDHSGIREYHSIKRQHSRGNWTVSALTQEGQNGRSILGDLVRKVQDEDADAVFSSGTSADELERLIEGARSSSSLEQFKKRIDKNARLSARFYDRVAPICSGEEGAYSTLRRLCVRTTNEPLLIQRVEQRIRKAFRKADGEPLQPRTTRLLIADIVLDNLGEPFTATSLLAELEGQGVLRSQFTGDRTVGEQIRQVNSTYLKGLEALLINGAEIVRTESKSAVQALLDDRRSVMLEGAAGGGKTGVLAQVVERLEAQGVPCLAVRLDRLSEADRPAQALGTNRGLPESPATTLGEFAGERPSVLCIDQLDALSLVSARQQWAWDVLNELLDEAETYPNMRLLFSCRSFDLEQDARLRALVDNPDEVERLAVGLLDRDTIRSAIQASGLATPSLTVNQMEVLSTPLHLYLFIEASRSGEVDFRAPGDLFDAFWRHKERAVAARTDPKPSGWSPTISALCDALSDRESLSAPDFVLDAHGEALKALASEGVVSTQGGSVSFFHESFFDYAFARTFLEADKDLVDWLVLDEQPLFRRSQVRQVLAFLRAREGPNSQRYIGTVERLLGDERVRFHIKKLLLDWFSRLASPTSSEWLVAEGLGQQLGDHMWNTVRNSTAWFDVLEEMGRWEVWLNGDDAQVDRAVTLLGMPRVLDQRGQQIAELVGPFRGTSDTWQHRLWWIVHRGHGLGSEGMQEVFTGLVADGVFDDPGPNEVTRHDFWQVLSVLSRESPAFTATALGSWFDRQLERAAEADVDDPFSTDAQLVTHSQISGRAMQECAKQAPNEFVRELFPRLVRFEQRVPQRWTLGPSMLGSPAEQLRETLGQAMASLALTDPPALDSAMNEAIDAGVHWTRWMVDVALRAWSANPKIYGDRTVAFLLEASGERLDLGYDISVGGTDSYVAISRTAIDSASRYCSDSSLAELERAILEFTPERERKARQVGWTRLALLGALDQGRISEVTRKHILELERKFPDAPERGAPAPPDGDGFSWVGPPVPQEAVPHMTDDEWLSAMAKYSKSGPTRRGNDFVGGSRELSRELEKATSEAPERFAALANRMDVSLAPVYFEAILRGVSRDRGGAGRREGLEQACSVLRRIEALDITVDGVDIARAIETQANENVPEDVVAMLLRVARDDPSPESDDGSGDPITQAINSGRGAAAVAIARLLFADRNRWSDLKPAVKKLVEDPVLAIRSVAVECLSAVLDSEREDALLLFENLVEGADSILGTHYVERFIHYSVFRDYLRVRPILHSMLASPSTAAVEVAAHQVVIAALWGDTEEALEDEHLVLAPGGEARVGAADIYAANVADPTVGPKCEVRLREMFDDDSDAVRRAAADCWGSLTPDQVASRGEFIHTFARSQAFADSGAGHLIHQLEKAEVPLPIEVCVLAELAVEEYGDKATSFQTAEGGDAYGLSKLMVRLHEETSDPTSRRRILDAIDGMVRAGFVGVDDRLKEQFER